MALDVKYLRGSKKRYQEYLKAGKIVPTNFYYLDDEELYLGTIKLSNQDDIKHAIKHLESQVSHDYVNKVELEDALNELSIEIDNNAYSLTEVKERVALNEINLRDLNSTVENLKSDLELKITDNVNDITDLKTDIAILKTISIGIGGDNEPSNIVSAINEAKMEAINYTDEVTSWKMI